MYDIVQLIIHMVDLIQMMSFSVEVQKHTIITCICMTENNIPRKIQFSVVKIMNNDNNMSTLYMPHPIQIGAIWKFYCVSYTILWHISLVGLHWKCHNSDT